jgi:predicted MFS family arabinose efflux permease
LPTSADAGALRRLLVVACAVVVTDTAFYAVITPLLPHYADEFGLSKGSVGLLAAAYSTGVVLAALPSGVLVARIGPRATVVTAMALLAIACLIFGFGGSFEVVATARLMQGAAGSLAWAGAFAWVLDLAPPTRRGQMIGTLLAAAVAGGLIGPLIGAVAEAVGPRPLFSSVVVLCTLVSLAAFTLPAPARLKVQGLRALARATRRRPVVIGSWLVGIVGLNYGVITVVGTLRLDYLGAGAVGIAAVFSITAAIELFVNPWVGRVVDRQGPFLPICWGLAIVTVAFCVFVLPSTVALQGAVIVLAFCSSASVWGPAMTFLSDAAARTGLQQGLILALMNLTWASGNMLGAIGGGAIAGTAGDALVAGVTAGLTAASLAVILSNRRSALAPAPEVVA